MIGHSGVSEKNVATLARNLDRVRSRIAAACQRTGRSLEHVTLIAVTKTAPTPLAHELLSLGQCELGESRPQELWRKAADLPSSVHWHLVGRLQTNKIRRTLPLVAMIHSLDRWTLAQTLSAEAVRVDRPVCVTVEINLSGEATKAGFSAEELVRVYPRLCELPGLHLVGLMTMAKHDPIVENCRPTFARLRQLREELRNRFPGRFTLDVLSMGMSHDFEVAVEEGATHVRVGAALFEGIEL
jgi:pyridoxal phosphate enzyme (YggS family)